MSADDADEALIPRADFDAVWDELEEFKKTSADLEKTLHASVQSKDHEVQLLKESLRKEQQQHGELKERVKQSRNDEHQLHETINELQTENKKLKELKVKLENDVERMERVHREKDFSVNQTESDRDAAVERGIVLQSEVEEVNELLIEAKRRADLAIRRADEAEDKLAATTRSIQQEDPHRSKMDSSDHNGKIVGADHAVVHVFNDGDESRSTQKNRRSAKEMTNKEQPEEELQVLREVVERLGSIAQMCRAQKRGGGAAALVAGDPTNPSAIAAALLAEKGDATPP